MSAITMHAIGTVRNQITDPVDSGWGEVISVVELEPRWTGAVDGLSEFSHAIILTYLHQAAGREVPVWRHPRNRTDMPLLGVLAQRARVRPNPIGITTCKIVDVEPNRLTIKGLDAISGTPVLDIKPYVPLFDRVETPEVPAWIGTLLSDYH
jgi:tRNA-Thr(GGU) m(6)t(6)A37 methyltransferase TsaA